MGVSHVGNSEAQQMTASGNVLLIGCTRCQPPVCIHALHTCLSVLENFTHTKKYFPVCVSFLLKHITLYLFTQAAFADLRTNGVKVHCSEISCIAVYESLIEI